MLGALDEALVALDLWRAQREGAPGLARRQAQRLASLVAYARTASPFYRGRYRGVTSERFALRDLPPVTKPELMSAFDDWVTDPAITRAGVDAFIADSARAGEPYLGRYFVCTSSGTTGRPGVFVHDARAMAVYHTALVARANYYRLWLTKRVFQILLRRGLRFANVVGTGGHFAGVSWGRRESHRFPWSEQNYRTLSALLPLPELVSELNAFDPTVIRVYPSVMSLLAEEQAAGRLHLQPIMIVTAGESFLPGARERITSAFASPIIDGFASSECLVPVFGCREEWLHVNGDWMILEPVEADYSPTPVGQPSHTVLLTNLANRVQPIIRYDLGDSVTARLDPCPCGSVLPAFRVAGRRDDVLRLDGGGGREVAIAPLAVGTVVDEVSGVHRSQLIQEAPRTIRLRLDLDSGADSETVWQRAISELSRYFVEQGAAGIEIIRATEPPEQVPGSGKFRQVIAHATARHG